ncbi:ABC transporter ATP-binding protein [Terrabacter sp. BE26]|uniref:ABC transporter ATP-binding protein n=1 Tax=Terrabacter sp. BE26 TaxID=2898152 RepID=UPI0035BE1525
MKDVPDPRAQGSTEILAAEDLRKTYGDRVALKGLTFSLDAGRVLGFLGPNGAGKTTSIRILTTILRPSAGRFSVDGIGSDRPQEIRRRIGVLPEGLGFPRQMTARGYLSYFAQLYGRPAGEARRIAADLLEDVGLQNRADSSVGSFSHGMRQRLGIARALVNDPAVVFLDEPTLGLDPRGQRELLRLIQRIARERRTGVVLCSHLLSEIEGVCDEVVIMSAGVVVAKGTVAEVVGASRPELDHVVRIRVPVASIARTQELLREVPGIDGDVRSEDSTGWVDVKLRASNGSGADASQVRNRLLESLIRADVPVLGFDTGGGRLEDVFLRLTAEAIQ